MSSVTLAALALLLYAAVGYPLILACLAQRRQPASSGARKGHEPSVSICLAVQDAARSLELKLESLLLLDYPEHKLEILVYCDGSTDGSDHIAQRYAAQDIRIRAIRCAERVGKARALNRLANAALGDVLVITDDSQPLAVDAIRVLVQRLADPSVGCVSGKLERVSREPPPSRWSYDRFIESCEGRLGNLVAVTGAIYAVRKRDFPLLPPGLSSDTQWVPLAIASRRKRVVLCEDAVAYAHAAPADDDFASLVESIKSSYQLFAHAPRLLLPLRNEAWFSLYCHPLLRLLCPWLLLVACAGAVGGAWFAPPESTLELRLLASLAFCHAVLAALAVLGESAGQPGVFARQLVRLLGAGFWGFWCFVRQPRSVEAPMRGATTTP